MIELNGKKFAENDKEFANSLFESGSTCVGYAKRLKRQIQLMDHQKNKIGVINRYNDWSDSLCKAGEIHSEQYNNYCYIGKYSEEAE